MWLCAGFPLISRWIRSDFAVVPRQFHGDSLKSSQRFSGSFSMVSSWFRDGYMAARGDSVAALVWLHGGHAVAPRILIFIIYSSFFTYHLLFIIKTIHSFHSFTIIIIIDGSRDRRTKYRIEPVALDRN